MRRTVRIGEKLIGPEHPVFITAEIGINHNGDVQVAKRLIDLVVETGCDAVKLQKRTPELCVPPEYQNVLRETPWGLITYLEYRKKIEFGLEEYQEINRYCGEKGIIWFTSCWDENSVDFMEQFDPPCYKSPSASLTDHALLRRMRATGKPVVLSTGMSTLEEVRAAVEVVGEHNLIIMHCTSTYPCRPEELNLRVIETYQKEFSCPIGYSGHEVGLQTTLAAVVLGARMVERHVTLDRAMWGTDQAASVEIQGMRRLVRDIRVTESALGDGVKQLYESERQAMYKLRRRVTGEES
jgi:N-acetylneuraminate synthase